MSADARVRLLAKLMRDTLSTSAADEFVNLGDLVDALKTRCGRLHVPWTPDTITEAVRLLASNVDLPFPRDARTLRELRPQGSVISQAEAAEILARLGVRL